MQVNNNFRLLAIFVVLATGCIEPYNPAISENQRLLVIEGQLTDRTGYHYIYISRSSSYNDPQIIPEWGCHVEVVDDQGNIFPFPEYARGLYQRWMNQGSLISGTSYKIRVITRDGNVYESDPEMLPTYCPPIDSVYFLIENRETNDPEITIEGVQFYIDVNPDDDIDRNFRWELTETWEYEAANFIQYYYDGSLHPMEDPWQLFRCWKTDRIHTIFTTTTKHSTGNSIKKYPLNYVSNESNRLRIKYSLLVRQCSMSDEAYEYWYQLQKQSQESGGFYETQPPQLTGNIYNVDDPDELVLGYFHVSSVTEKRIFVRESFPFRTPGPRCTLDTIDNLFELNKYNLFPVYLKSINVLGYGPPWVIGRQLCFDCRLGGGTEIKPSFWE